MKSHRERLEFWICFNLTANTFARMIDFKDEIKDEINTLLSEYAERYYI